MWGNKNSVFYTIKRIRLQYLKEFNTVQTIDLFEIELSALDN